MDTPPPGALDAQMLVDNLRKKLADVQFDNIVLETRVQQLEFQIAQAAARQ